MTSYAATVQWRRTSQSQFTDGKYSRAHMWQFDGGARVLASSSPRVVPVPFSATEYVDPEEAFVAALASCHMLFFLSGAAKGGFVVDRYEDTAHGTMENNDDGRMAMVRIVLAPKVAYAGTAPNRMAKAALHHGAHHQCFLANSVKTTIEIRLDGSETEPPAHRS